MTYCEYYVMEIYPSYICNKNRNLKKDTFHSSMTEDMETGYDFGVTLRATNNYLTKVRGQPFV